MSLAYLPGRYPPAPEPLSRFLPPIPDEVAAVWLSTRAPRGAWILDPFGTSPRLVVEMARQGYRVIVAANNPILRFLVEMAASPPSREELQASLAVLAGSYRGAERLELHIRSLYQTECARCGSPVIADAFLWENAEGGRSAAAAPYARVYTCPICRDSGERPCNAADIARAASINANSLSRARALERVAPRNDPDRPYAEQAISVYLSRAVYALFTLINKLDGLDIPLVHRRNLTALILYACDQANTMWKFPVERERRYQLVIPSRFREVNIWCALEQAVDVWCAERLPGNETVIPLSAWPASIDQQIPSSGIWLFEGRLKDLTHSLSGVHIQAVCTALPRPNRAFWTLSALWAGWLWGSEAVGPFRSVLRRQRYDWGWHTTALNASLSHLQRVLTAGTPLLGLMGEFEPNYLAAALVAAGLAGFNLESVAIRQENTQAQICWQQNPAALPQAEHTADKCAVQAVTRYLEERGEPGGYAHAFSAALIALARDSIFQSSRSALAEENSAESAEPAEVYAQTAALCKDSLSYRNGFLRYPTQAKTKIDTGQLPPVQAVMTFAEEPGVDALEPPGEKKNIAEKDRPGAEQPESGLIWLQDANRATTSPQADRMEVLLVNYLLKHPGCRFTEIDAALCAAFPGLFTPEPEYLQICLDSYAELDPETNATWQLRQADAPSVRRSDLDEARQLLGRLGERLGFSILPNPLPSTSIQTSQPSSLCWSDRYQQPQYWLFPIASARIGEIILQNPVPSGRGLIILPGGRANLVAYKLRRDPRLGRLCDSTQGGWRFIKFRHLRWLEGNPLLTRDNLDEYLALDPLTYSTPQLRLL